ncbi:hypothetical protein J4711_13585 [Staphylococcus epidermidis]|nr:hypothetical protein [Staphylococcus epidermidis]
MPGFVTSEGRIRNELTAKGMQIVEPADGEKEWISKATSGRLACKFYDSIGGKAKLDQVLRTRGVESETILPSKALSWRGQHLTF